MLAVVPETRQVLGLAHSQVVLREPRARKRKDGRRSAEAKVWEVAAHEMGQPPVGTKWVHVTDRGSDGFEYMTACHEEGTDFVVRAWEPDPPVGAERVEWILITSVPVNTLSDAKRIVGWYTCRWLCEDYHQCLKTGCRIEDTQLDDASDIQRLLGLKIPIAVRLLQLRQLVRVSSDQLAQKLVDPLLVKIAAHVQNRDAASMTMTDFWINVAKTGGYQGRRSDGSPGWRTLWAGWCYITDLATGARLFASGAT